MYEVVERVKPAHCAKSTTHHVCTLPDTEVYNITIVNNGLRSHESLIYITYDPFCYTCTTQGCTVKVRVPAWLGAKAKCSYLVNYIGYSLVYINLFSSRI